MLYTHGFSPISKAKQSVRMGAYSSLTSAVTSSSVCVPQWSVLGPLLFSIYTSPLSTIAESQQVFQQQYADAMQLYVSLSTLNYHIKLTTLESCLRSLHVWFCDNGIVLNPTKSDAILFGTSQRLKTMSSLISVDIAGSVIQLLDTIKILGVTLDSSLTVGPYTKALSKSCFYHLWSFKQICSSMDDPMAISAASAVKSPRLVMSTLC